MSIHRDQKVLERGEELEDASQAVVMLHGRGATAESIVELTSHLPDAAYLAPQAKTREWYPHSFLEPREKNQPHLDSALEKVDAVVERAAEHLPRDKIVLLGFSQGACLASEYVASNPRRYGGAIVFSGGLIGEEVQDYSGDLERTPVFIGCSENDPHIPLKRVNETVEVFENLDADIKKTIYEGSSHTVNDDELQSAAEIIRNA